MCLCKLQPSWMSTHCRHCPVLIVLFSQSDTFALAVLLWRWSLCAALVLQLFAFIWIWDWKEKKRDPTGSVSESSKLCKESLNMAGNLIGPLADCGTNVHIVFHINRWHHMTAGPLKCQSKKTHTMLRPPSEKHSMWAAKITTDKFNEQVSLFLNRATSEAAHCLCWVWRPQLTLPASRPLWSLCATIDGEK